MKKILSTILVVLLVITVIPMGILSMSVSAATIYNDANGSGFKFTVVNSKACIVGYSGTKTDLAIPSTVKYGIDYTVRYIGNNAFKNRSDIISATIPYGVEYIGEYAFAQCRNLEKVTINNGVETIYMYAFEDCNKLEEIIIPPSLQKLANNVFKNCKISKVHITDLTAWCNIEFIGNDFSAYFNPLGGGGSLYLNNQPLTNLIIPEGIDKIKSYTFNNCDSIKSVIIPTTVTDIYSNAFAGCDGITDVWYTGGKSESNNIKINDNNSYLLDATWHYDSCPVGAPHSYDNDCDDTCNGCSKKRTVSGHSYDNACDTQCNICNSNRTISHAYGEWEVTKQASCIESGNKVRKCSVCSKTETDIISSLGHNFSTEWTTDKKATCTTAGSKSNHCTRCSATSNNTTILSSGHNWGKWVTEKKATEKAEGLSVRKCNECGLKETQSIAKLAADGHTHKFGEWQIIKAATCKEKGNAKRICSVCKEEEQKELLATGHQVGEWVETSATCTNDGNRERVCVICNETEKITIKALGHDFENPVVIKEPTDNEKGIKQGKCKRCGEETTEEIPALLSDNASNTDSNKKTDGAIGENEDKNTNNNWVIWTIIGVLVLVGIGFGVYLILKKNRPNNQE